jgi:hypothetical protein
MIWAGFPSGCSRTQQGELALTRAGALARAGPQIPGPFGTVGYR